jgi:hypothetical protein
VPNESARTYERNILAHWARELGGNERMARRCLPHSPGNRMLIHWHRWLTAAEYAWACGTALPQSNCSCRDKMVLRWSRADIYALQLWGPLAHAADGVQPENVELGHWLKVLLGNWSRTPAMHSYNRTINEPK